MKIIAIELEGADGLYSATVTPVEKNGLLRFMVSGSDPGDKSMPDWQIEIEPDCDGWKQTGQSLQNGPKMPCFLIEEIGEKLEAGLK